MTHTHTHNITLNTIIISSYTSTHLVINALLTHDKFVCTIYCECMCVCVCMCAVYPSDIVHLYINMYMCVCVFVWAHVIAIISLWDETRVGECTRNFVKDMRYLESVSETGGGGKRGRGRRRRRRKGRVQGTCTCDISINNDFTKFDTLCPSLMWQSF